MEPNRPSWRAIIVGTVVIVGGLLALYWALSGLAFMGGPEYAR